MDDYIVEVRCDVVHMGLQDDNHQALECWRHLMEAKGQNAVLPMVCGGTEDCFGYGGRGEGNLPVPFG